MTTHTSEHTHPVSGAVAAMLETLAGLTDTPLWSMGAEETADTVRDLARLRAAVAELELRTAAHADHDPTYQVTEHPDGQIELHRRT